MSENRPLFVVEDASLVGRIHAMLVDLHRQGRVSCAEVALVHALTMHPVLPSAFRNASSSPTQAGVPLAVPSVAPART